MGILTVMLVLYDINDATFMILNHTALREYKEMETKHPMSYEMYKKNANYQFVINNCKFNVNI